MLEFDAATARLLEIAYQGADVTRRRRANFDALEPRPGEHILDIGCGNGLLSAEIARAVGPEGRVTGIDPSAEMRALAVERCAEYPWVALVEGTAEALGVADGAADRAVSLQVFEYLPALGPALAEAHRALRPDGRLVIGDWHWDTLVWESDEPDRMAGMIRLWDGHLSERRVPALLPEALAAAGFEAERMIPVTFCDTHLAPDGLAMMMLRLMERYAVAKGAAEGMPAAWRAEQEDRAAAGRFFFSMTHYVAVARRR